MSSSFQRDSCWLKTRYLSLSPRSQPVARPALSAVCRASVQAGGATSTERLSAGPVYRLEAHQTPGERLSAGPVYRLEAHQTPSGRLSAGPVYRLEAHQAPSGCLQGQCTGWRRIKHRASGCLQGQCTGWRRIKHRASGCKTCGPLSAGTGYTRPVLSFIFVT